MAGVNFTADSTANTSNTAPNVRKTILQGIQAANSRGRLKSVDFNIGGSAAGAPVLCEVAKQTTAGTNGASPATPTVAAYGDVTETVQTTFVAADPAANWTVEPTTLGSLAAENLPALGGGTITFDPPLPVPGGTRLGFLVTAPVGATPVRVVPHYEE